MLDNQIICTWSVKLPVYIDYKFGYTQREKPLFCLGRPIAEPLGLCVDFAPQTLRFQDSEWEPATLGRHGEYLLPLTATFTEEQLNMEPDFDLVVEADAGPRKSFKDFCTEVAFHVEDHDIIQGERPCSEKRWKGLHHALQEKTNELHAMVTHALHTEKPQKRILWENCVAAVAEALNMETRLFGYRTGWNFQP